MSVSTGEDTIVDLLTLQALLLDLTRGKTSMEETLGQGLALVLQSVGCSAGRLVLHDSDSDRSQLWHVAGGQPISQSGGTPSAQELRVMALAGADGSAPDAKVDSAEPGTSITWPLVAGNAVLGAITVQQSHGPLSDQQKGQLAIAAAQVATAVGLVVAQESEQRSAHKLALLQQESADAILYTDLQGVILGANAAAKMLLAPADGQLAGHHITDLLADSSQAPALESLAGGSSHHFTAAVHAPGGAAQRPMRVRARPDSGTPATFLQWIMRDVSREVELEQLRNDLASMLVHDLRVPLGNVIASLEIAQVANSDSNPDEAEEMLDLALHSGYQLRALVDTTLDISRLERGQPLTDRNAVPVNEVLQRVVDLLHYDLEARRITPVIEVDASVPAVFGNADMLQRVFLNLLDNALKASRAGQQIKVRAERLPGTSLVKFTVVDEGQGIPEQYRERIFEKYQRVNIAGASKGLGLGLAFCRLAVQAHGGEIWVTEAEGGGASFQFTLPVAQDEDARPHPDQA